MVLSNDNNNNHPNIAKPTNVHPGGLETGSRKFGQENSRQTRRALSLINQNIVGAQAYPRVVVNKRGLSEKHGVCEKKQRDPVHRPITRKFAAQLVSSQQLLHKVQETTKKSDPKTNGFGDCIFIDVEEEDNDATSTNNNDLPVPEPMSLEQTEEGPEATINEMEDVVEEPEPILDIDVRDAKNPLAVVDYVEDLYAFYKKMELFSFVSPNYMEQQFDINEKMRAILIDWLIEVHDKFDLMKETLFLTINLIDRFLSQQSVIKKRLQLVGLVALLLACKYEEVSVPIVGDLVLMSDKAYTREEILEMEKLMLKTLQFNLSFPTPFVFMQRFLKASESDKKLEMLSFFFIELALVEYEMLKFPFSLLAAAAVYTAQCTLYGFKQWSRTSEWHSNYSEEQLSECSILMVGFHQKASTGRLTGVHRKYCTSKFGYTAKCQPAVFLLETQP
ncbi:G2/mitotic-specific cyclin-2-like [Tripterygium wilfordii]|uniref:G2/mitotic-specific cyclin-2-like n=1 Tax=Tripterygium wilfordii TaxID=458696 RepID=UPI0018F86294|nr:G2/mitotic-specific cyclin-2-like [Tripterygium wilfordii]